MWNAQPQLPSQPNSQQVIDLYLFPSFLSPRKPFAWLLMYLITQSLDMLSLSDIVSKVSRLKPEIRLAQAISYFEADLSSEQKNVFHLYRSQSLQSPPDLSDVMRLTAEIDRQASGKVGGRCFGPRFTNFLQVAQQFAALGDIMVRDSQNVIACGVWALLRMSLLVSGFTSFTAFFINTWIVNRKFLILSRKAIDSFHARWSRSITLPNNGPALSSIQGSPVTSRRILHCIRPPLSPDFEIYQTVDIPTNCIHFRRLRYKAVSIEARSLGKLHQGRNEPADGHED